MSTVTVTIPAALFDRYRVARIQAAAIAEAMPENEESAPAETWEAWRRAVAEQDLAASLIAMSIYTQRGGMTDG